MGTASPRFVFPEPIGDGVPAPSGSNCDTALNRAGRALVIGCGTDGLSGPGPANQKPPSPGANPPP